MLKQNHPYEIFHVYSSNIQEAILLRKIKSHFMYSVNLLQTKADCDALITIATKDKDNLEFRKESLERQSATATETAVEIQAELEAINAQLSYLDGIIASLPDGKLKEENVAKWRKADYRKFLLTNRKNNYGVVAAIDKEYDIGCIQKSIEETDNFIAAITERKNAL